MPDIIDDAQRHEAMFLAHALASREEPMDVGPQFVIDGVVCCLECEEPIPLARLAAVPGCVRCAACQAEEESL